MCELWRQERDLENCFHAVIQPIFVEESAIFSLWYWPSTDPHYRADRFVERWQQLGQRREALDRSGSDSASKACGRAMADMAKGLERDPQVESILRNRKLELGIMIESTRSFGDDLAFSIGLGRGRGLGI